MRNHRPAEPGAGEQRDAFFFRRQWYRAHCSVGLHGADQLRMTAVRHIGDLRHLMPLEAIEYVCRPVRHCALRLCGQLIRRLRLVSTLSRAISAAMAATAAAAHLGSKVMGFIAIVLAMINVVGGFGVTHRMMRMFHTTSKSREGGALS